jgi:hypothetical protein
MSATGADPQSDRTRLHRESRTWGLIRRTLPLGRSIGSLSYLISVGLIATWLIAVFFGVGLFFLKPQPAKPGSGASPASPYLNAASAEAPLLMQSTSRLDRLSTLPPSWPSQPMDGAAADKVRPVLPPGNENMADVNPQVLLAAPSAIPAALDEAAPMLAPQNQLSTPPEPRGSSRPVHPASSRKPPERRTANIRTALPHAPVNAIQDVLQKHSGLLK